ncbi:MAG: cyclic pyranopterin monophosphate synthase MoaC [Deltaproteobacteria bacterium]|nr:cyclic pyranopterin monophosphate synthase MoaC [Deltaproteobacteria bacterium]
MGQKADFTHFDDSGRARMVDVSSKPDTVREAVARGSIIVKTETLRAIKSGVVKKGDVLAVADVAAVMTAKKTPEIIPMCHPIALSGVEVDFSDKELDGDRAEVTITVTTRCTGPTGVEMEALTAVSGALLTIYDMCKSADKTMTIQGIELLEKKGGRSGHWKKQ